MSSKIQIKYAEENQLKFTLSTSPEKKERGVLISSTGENISVTEHVFAVPARPFKPSISSHSQPIAFPSEEQLITSARNLFEKAQQFFLQQGPNAESIKLCRKALKIPFVDCNLRYQGLFQLALFYDKRARSEVAMLDDLDCAIKIQETLLGMEYHPSPIEKAKLQYMLARNIMSKALKENDLIGVKHVITLVEEILAQDFLNDHQRTGLERNLAKAIRAKSLLEPEDHWLTYLT